jgi:uncharacterized membrane protein
VKRDTRIVAAVVAAIPIAILSAAAICTFAIASGASMKWRMLFRVLCHGIPTRCLQLFDTPMPICARCTGIYLGLLAGLIAFWVLPPIQERMLRVALFVAALPMAVDGITQASLLRESTNGLRVATGFTAAIVFGIWVLEAVENRESPVVTIP